MKIFNNIKYLKCLKISFEEDLSMRGQEERRALVVRIKEARQKGVVRVDKKRDQNELMTEVLLKTRPKK